MVEAMTDYAQQVNSQMSQMGSNDPNSMPDNGMVFQPPQQQGQYISTSDQMQQQLQQQMLQQQMQQQMQQQQQLLLQQQIQQQMQQPIQPKPNGSIGVPSVATSAGPKSMTPTGLMEHFKSFMKEPIAIAVLFIVLCMPQVGDLLGKYIPMLGENNMMMNILKALILAVLYSAMKLFNVL